jgi:hypothetical protein
LRRAGADVLDRHATTFIGDIPSEFHYHVSETGERQACLRSYFATNTELRARPSG